MMSRATFAIACCAALAALAGCSDDPARAVPAAQHQHPHTKDAGSSATDSGHPHASDAGADAAVSPIVDFVAAQAYHDFASVALLGLQRAHKFEAFLDPRLGPSQVASVRVLGPNDFAFEFANEPFDDALNGYIYNEGVLALWYQAIEFYPLEDGRYTLEVTLTDGRRGELSRELVTNTALVDFYLAHKDEMKYSPSEDSSPADDTVLHWTTFHDLGGPDAYYNAWISPGTDEYVAAGSLRGDTIFDDAMHDPKAGLNNGSSRQGSKDSPLPLGPMTWQPEILDANVLEEVNQIIFPPGQHFDAQ